MSDETKNFDDDPIYRPREAAAYIGLSDSRLAAYRSEGDPDGPDFVRLGNQRVGYRRSALNAYLDRRKNVRLAYPRRDPEYIEARDGSMISHEDISYFEGTTDGVYAVLKRGAGRVLLAARNLDELRHPELMARETDA